MCLRQGLDHEFADIFSQHIRDLNLFVAEGSQGPIGSFIDVVRTNEGNEASSWERIAILGRKDLIDRKESLQKAANDAGLPEPDEMKVESLALDWLFYELAFDALNNACYMQHNYGKYIRDFDGQGPNYLAQYTMSNEFLKKYPSSAPTIEVDYLRAKAGFALILLHDAAIAKGVFPHAKQVDWLVNQLSENVMNSPLDKPFTSQEIRVHLRNMSPDRNGRARLADFILSLDDEEQTSS
jgi:hypothetical protein